MHHEPQTGPPAAADGDARGAAGHDDAARPAPAIRQPAAQELDDALRSHRRDPEQVQYRNKLMLLLYRSVAVQARELTAWRFRSLAHREDELVLRTLARIEGKEDGGPGASGVPLQLLAGYEFRTTGRSIYNYVLQKTSNIARNMQSEAYVPDGGFWSKDLKAGFNSTALQQRVGASARRSGTQIETPIASPEDEEADAFSSAVPHGLRWSETPLRQSVLRINSLARKLDALASDMVGKTWSGVDESGAVISRGPLTVNHQRIWRAWLGLSHPDLIDLAEEDLAHALGLSKATVTRDTSAAFAYMLQHPDLNALLVLMEPNRFQSSAAADKHLDLKLAELKTALREPNGKSFFRKCVHQWLGEHV